MISYGLFKRIMLLVVITVLSACATSPETKPEKTAKAVLSKEKTADVPENQELNKELLESLLIERFSVYSSDWKT